MIELCVEPGRVQTFEEFAADSAAHDIGSIALDGRVYGPWRYEQVTGSDGELVGVQNFNHHEDVARFATMSTCKQVQFALRSKGFRTAFENHNGLFEARVHINDGDQDTSAAVWQLRNPWHVKGNNVLVNKYIDVQDKLDITSGAYPFDIDLEFLQVVNWVNEPYQRARLRGEHMSRDPHVVHSIVDEVGYRLDKLVAGTAERLPLDPDFDAFEEGINGDVNWVAARETGAQSRQGISAAGIVALVSIRDQNPNRTDVSLWRESAWVNFPLRGILDDLNEIEGGTTDDDKWGGSDDSGGSPRLNGTKLTTDEILDVVATRTHTQRHVLSRSGV